MNRVQRVAAVGAVCLSLGGCGVPVSDQPRVLRTEQVPYRLLGPPANASSPPAHEGRGEQKGQIALVLGDGAIDLVSRVIPRGAPQRQVQAVLDQLLRGPTDDERARGCDSTLPAGVSLRVRAVQEGIATIELGGDIAAQAADRLPLSVAQIVLSATSVDGVRAVLLQRDGRPVDAPLPDGRLASEPLTADRYTSLLVDH